MTGHRRTTYLIQDPYDLDALQFIRTIDVYFGMRPVCFYTDAKARFYGEQQYPLLVSDLIERSVDVDLGDLSSFATQISAEYDIAGVVPYREDTVEVAAELCHLLDIGCVGADTLARFRDKFALKSFVSSVDPTVRVPTCSLIRTRSELEQVDLPERFVVKPNNGYGNQSIGIFDSSEIDLAIAHIESRPGVEWILEEFIGGIEYHIDGQVRGAGEVASLAVLEYVRTEVNGYPTVYLGEIQCQTSHPRFDVLVAYAARLLTATGLQRCPFHLEVKFDDDGPCVVDLGARMPSEAGGKSLSRMHPTRPDAFAVAASDYLSGGLHVEEVVDWSHYDSARTVLVYGVSEIEGFVETVDGVDEVDGWPEFVRWIQKPSVGDRLEKTCDLRGASYIVELTCPGERTDALALIDAVRRSITLNAESGRRTALLARAADLNRRVRPKLRWLGHRIRLGVAG